MNEAHFIQQELLYHLDLVTDPYGEPVSAEPIHPRQIPTTPPDRILEVLFNNQQTATVAIWRTKKSPG